MDDQGHSEFLGVICSIFLLSSWMKNDCIGWWKVWETLAFVLLRIDESIMYRRGTGDPIFEDLVL